LTALADRAGCCLFVGSADTVFGDVHGHNIICIFFNKLNWNGILSPEDDVLGKYPGMTRNLNDFLKFLDKGLAG